MSCVTSASIDFRRSIIFAAVRCSGICRIGAFTIYPSQKIVAAKEKMMSTGKTLALFGAVLFLQIAPYCLIYAAVYFLKP